MDNIQIDNRHTINNGQSQYSGYIGFDAKYSSNVNQEKLIDAIRYRYSYNY